jgi:hypothetical protein
MVAFIRPRSTMLPLSLLTALATMGRKARWMATITPPAEASSPAELALLDRHTNEQRLITPAHNSFNQAFSKIYDSKVCVCVGGG